MISRFFLCLIIFYCLLGVDCEAASAPTLSKTKSVPKSAATSAADLVTDFLQRELAELINYRIFSEELLNRLKTLRVPSEDLPDEKTAKQLENENPEKYYYGYEKDPDYKKPRLVALTIQNCLQIRKTILMGLRIFGIRPNAIFEDLMVSLKKALSYFSRNVSGDLTIQHQKLR